MGKPALPSWRRWRVDRTTGVTQLPFLAISGPGHRSNGLSALPSKGRTRRAVKRRGASDDRFCCSVLGVLGVWFQRRRVRKFASAIFAFWGSSDLKNRLSLSFWGFFRVDRFLSSFLPHCFDLFIGKLEFGVHVVYSRLEWRIVSSIFLGVFWAAGVWGLSVVDL